MGPSIDAFENYVWKIQKLFRILLRMELYRFDFLLESTDISIILRLNREKQWGDSVESAWPYAPEKCFFRLVRRTRNLIGHLMALRDACGMKSRTFLNPHRSPLCGMVTSGFPGNQSDPALRDDFAWPWIDSISSKPVIIHCGILFVYTLK